MKKQLLKTISLLLFTSFTIPAFAADAAEDPYADTVLHSWGGVRSALDKRGIGAALNYKGDFWDAADGGAKTGTAYVGAATLGLNFDNEKLLGIRGNTASLQLQNTHGGKPNAFAGSNQGVDNFEAATSNTYVYEAWVQQNFLNDRLSFLVGLRDLNVEFVETDMSANFIKPVMQIGQDFAQSGKNGPSIYPVTGLAARVKVKPTANSYVQAAAFDGVPGSLSDPHGTHINLSSNDGALLIAEAGLTPGNAPDAGIVANKFAVGAWTYTKQFPDYTAVDAAGDPILNKSQGVYVLTSYQFYKDKKDRTLGGFLRAGEDNGDVNQIEWAYEAGLVANGWVPGRKDAEIGLGLGHAHNGDHYITTVPNNERNELGFELYYRDPILPGVTIQPDLQYVVNPGMMPSQQDATMLGMRVDINF